jgi:hypothetical protein
METRRNKPQLRKLLTTEQKKALFTAAARNIDTCELLIQAKLEIKHFSEQDYYLWKTWEAIQEFYDEFYELPNEQDLRLNLHVSVGDDTNIPDEIVAEIGDLLDEIYTNPITIKFAAAGKLLQQFLNEFVWRNIQDAARDITYAPKSIREVLVENLQSAEQADTVVANPIPEAFPEGYENEERDIRTIPTGVNFMDSFWDGGIANGEISCILAPTGSGKTTLAQQLSLSVAMLESSKWEYNGKRGSLGVAYFVSYELPAMVIRCRALAYTAQIPYSALSKKLKLSSGYTLNERDKEKFADAIRQGIQVPTEQIRKKYAESRLNLNWKLLDYSGFDKKNPSRGGGGVVEIMQQIEADLRSYEQAGQRRYVAGIFLDYIGMMGLRYCAVHAKDPSENLRMICKTAVDDCRRYLAKRFACPVIVTHQLSAKGADMAPGIVSRMDNADECRTIAHNCDFVYVISQLVKETGIGRMECQKGRRSAGQPPIIIQLDGQYAQVKENKYDYVWDDDKRKFQKANVQPNIKDEPADDFKFKPVRPAFNGQELTILELL